MDFLGVIVFIWILFSSQLYSEYLESDHPEEYIRKVFYTKIKLIIRNKARILDYLKRKAELWLKLLASVYVMKG